MDKKDYIWLTRNTEIDNFCERFEDCSAQSVIFKLFRKSHLPKIKEIFAGHPSEQYEDKQDNVYFTVKDTSLTDLCAVAMQYNSDITYIDEDKRSCFEPVDRQKYRNLFWRKTPLQLSQLPPAEKLNILFALNKDYYLSAGGDRRHFAALANQSNKINALLQLPIPQAFWEREQRKIRLITAAISEIPNIKEKLENFAKLDGPAQQRLLKQTAALTAHYGGIATPAIFLVTQKEMRQLAGGGWPTTDAINIEKEIYISKPWLKKQSGIRCLSLAWHETNHVVMAGGDYSQFPLMDDMLNPRLTYLGDIEEAYIMSPQEKINYALERQFIEECVARTGVKQLGNTFKPAAELDVATQYIARSLQKEH